MTTVLTTNVQKYLCLNSVLYILYEGITSYDQFQDFFSHFLYLTTCVAEHSMCFLLVLLLAKKMIP